MIDMTVDVIKALENDPALFSLVENKIFQLTVPKKFSDKYPYIRIAELNNFDDHFAENTAVSSDISYQIDYWTTDDPRQIGFEIDRIMKSLGFQRYSVTSFYEEDTGAFRKALRYRTTKIF